jgi:hypothetical protein
MANKAFYVFRVKNLEAQLEGLKMEFKAERRPFNEEKEAHSNQLNHLMDGNVLTFNEYLMNTCQWTISQEIKKEKEVQ